MALCYFCSQHSVAKYRTLYRTNICKDCHATLLEHGIQKSAEQLDREQQEWMASRRISLEQQAWGFFTPRSRTEQDIQEKSLLASAVLFSAGVWILWTFDIHILLSAIIMLPVAAFTYKTYKHSRLEQEANSIKAENEQSRKEYMLAEELKLQRIQAQVLDEAERRFARFRKICDVAKSGGILLWEYYKFDYPPDWEHRCQRVQKRDKFRCTSCQAQREVLQVHHKATVGSGGSHHLYNLTTLCKRCHLKEHPWLIQHMPSINTTQPIQPQHQPVFTKGSLVAADRKIEISCFNKNCPYTLRIPLSEVGSAQKRLKVTCPKCRTKFLWDSVRGQCELAE
jgi:hypothetical protein